MSGYIVLNKTGDESVDVIVDMLVSAGSAYHHTEGWWEDWVDGRTILESLQYKLDNLADEVKALKAKVAENESTSSANSKD